MSSRPSFGFVRCGVRPERTARAETGGGPHLPSFGFGVPSELPLTLCTARARVGRRGYGFRWLARLREEKGFDHLAIALSVGVQRMVRSDEGAAGVLFTIDTETGFPDLVLTNAAWGLGENVVKGTVNPDQYTVFKPLLEEAGRVPIIGKRLGRKERKMIYAAQGGTTRDVETTGEERRSWVLSDDDILRLARRGVGSEGHHRRPADGRVAARGTDAQTPRGASGCRRSAIPRV